ncbi:Protein cereblon [Sergentomyia squamirostris]
MDPEDTEAREESEGDDEIEMLDASGIYDVVAAEDAGSGSSGSQEAENNTNGMRFGMRYYNTDRNVSWIFRTLQRFYRESTSSGSDEDARSGRASNEDGDEGTPSGPPQNFDTELPTNHSYLGKMESVSGIDYYEPGKKYQIHVSPHHSIIFPGQTLPVILSQSQAFHLNNQTEGRSIGLVFPPFGSEQYGVTCQMYETNVRNPRLDLRAKLRAHQRFRVCKESKRNNVFVGEVGDVVEVEVEILPELSLGCPLGNHFRGSLEKFLPRSSRVKMLYCHARTWPLFVYDQYDIGRVMAKIKHFLAAHKIETMPMDPILCSFWSAKNLPLEQEDRDRIFATNYVEVRMRIIAEKLNDPYYYHCAECNHKVAKFSDVFAMSKDGVQASYCNPGGYIHDTVTLYHVEEDALAVERRKSTEFSWFPGYAWKISICSQCRWHLGWQFVAEKKNLMPQSFYGLSQRNIVLKL